MPLPIQISFPKTTVSGFDVFRFDMTDQLSTLFEARLRVRSSDATLDFNSVVGEQVTIHFSDEPFLTAVQGLVRRAAQLTTEPTGVSEFELTVVPTFWLTTRRTDHRIFQNLSVPEIVAEVIRGYGGRIDALGLNFTNDHDKREYCVQYGETDHDFLRRILADEGIAWFFDHANGSVLTLVDESSVNTPSLATPIKFNPPSNQTPESATTPLVHNVAVASNVETSASTVRDYNPFTPELRPQGKTAMKGASFANEANLETYRYEVGKFTDDKHGGDARAGQLLEARRALERVLTCDTNFALGAGQRFSLTLHPRSDVDGPLLVFRSTLSASDDGSGVAPVRRNVLETIPATTPFRPELLPKPRVVGTQTAFVVGAPGEEIDVDAAGRVLVEFRWDRRDLGTGATSRRVRVTQSWAGVFYGLSFIPRVKDEVVVTYLDGDPDEPLIVGVVHNAARPAPQKLPDEKTVSTWRSLSSPGGNGFNQILMDDLAGAERLELRAQRDFKNEALRNSDTTVGVNQSAKVGANQSSVIGGNKSESIAGSQSTSIGGDLSIRAQNIRIDGTDVTMAGSTAVTCVGPVATIESSFAEASLVLDGSKATLSADIITITAKSTLILCAPSVQIVGGVTNITGAPIKLNCGDE